MLSTFDSQQGDGFSTGLAPSQGLMDDRHDSASPPSDSTSGPDRNQFMVAIRDQAIFAWALTGINGALSDIAEGKP